VYFGEYIPESTASRGVIGSNIVLLSGFNTIGSLICDTPRFGLTHILSNVNNEGIRGLQSTCEPTLTKILSLELRKKGSLLWVT